MIPINQLINEQAILSHKTEDISLSELCLTMLRHVPPIQLDCLRLKRGAISDESISELDKHLDGLLSDIEKTMCALSISVSDVNTRIFLTGKYRFVYLATQIGEAVVDIQLSISHKHYLHHEHEENEGIKQYATIKIICLLTLIARLKEYIFDIRKQS
jgi:hypothetical protein